MPRAIAHSAHGALACTGAGVAVMVTVTVASAQLSSEATPVAFSRLTNWAVLLSGVKVVLGLT